MTNRDVTDGLVVPLGEMDTETRRLPAIFQRGTKVLAPVGRRKDGEWSRTHRIIAIFLDDREAVKYAKTKKAEGAYLVRPGVKSA